VCVESRVVCRAQRQAIAPIVGAPIGLTANVSGLNQVRVRDRTHCAFAAVLFQDRKTKALLSNSYLHLSDSALWLLVYEAERSVRLRNGQDGG
jgi:hypothetical protein